MPIVNVNEDLSGKLDKNTTSTTYYQAYVKNTTGEQIMIDVANNNRTYSIPFRDGNNRIEVGTPSTNNQATNKQYVDSAISSAVPNFNPTEVEVLEAV